MSQDQRWMRSQSWVKCFLSKGSSKCKGPVVENELGPSEEQKTSMAKAGIRSSSLAQVRLDITFPSPCLPSRAHLLPFLGV